MKNQEVINQFFKSAATKTITAKELHNRIKTNLFTKKGQLKCRYKDVICWLLENPQKRVHPKKWSNQNLNRQIRSIY